MLLTALGLPRDRKSNQPSVRMQTGQLLQYVGSAQKKRRPCFGNHVPWLSKDPQSQPSQLAGDLAQESVNTQTMRPKS